jgi:hypothetical protein
MIFPQGYRTRTIGSWATEGTRSISLPIFPSAIRPQKTRDKARLANLNLSLRYLSSWDPIFKRYALTRGCRHDRPKFRFGPIRRPCNLCLPRHPVGRWMRKSPNRRECRHIGDKAWRHLCQQHELRRCRPILCQLQSVSAPARSRGSRIEHFGFGAGRAQSLSSSRLGRRFAGIPELRTGNVPA